MPADESPTRHSVRLSTFSLDLEMSLELPVVDESIHRRFRMCTRGPQGRDYGREHIGRGSSLSRVGCRCQVDGVTGVPRNERGLRRAVNALISAR